MVKGAIKQGHHLKPTNCVAREQRSTQKQVEYWSLLWAESSSATEHLRKDIVLLYGTRSQALLSEQKRHRESKHMELHADVDIPDNTCLPVTPGFDHGGTGARSCQFCKLRSQLR